MNKPFFIPSDASPAVPFAAVGYFINYGADGSPSDCLWIVPGTIRMED